MGNTTVKEHYETAPKTGVFKLSNKLDKFPPKLFEIQTTLRTLDLSENKISCVPDEIGGFTNLKHLRLNRNRLATLPEALGLISKLESIHVADNNLLQVPQSIAKLTNLKQINLSGNNLTEFPNIFEKLKNLDVLDLSRNKITTIPPHVKGVHAVELILNRNQISFIAAEIAKCERLRTLRLEENCLELSSVPVPLLKDSTVSVITLEGNLFEMKALADVEGFNNYMDRYTAMKKKMF